MKVTVTGSLGHISRPLTEMLLKAGHEVTVVSSSADRKEEIEKLGAKAAIGTLQDAEFLASAFTGADVVYAMEALGAGVFFDHNIDIIAANTAIAESYRQAIAQSGVKRVVHLSSIGAHTNEGNGILAFHYNAERILNELPADVSIKFMRPVGFYYNLLSYIPLIKAQGIIVSNYGGDDKEPWVSPLDIAAAIAEEIEKPFDGRTIRYIASDEFSPNEAAKALGEAIGMPGLKWVTISDAELLNNLTAAGMNPQTAKGYAEMNASRCGGLLYEDYNCHRPVLGRVKFADYAKEFAAAFNRNN